MNILIADDEPLARDRLARLVRQLPGYQLLDAQAENGIQALELSQSLQPDAILLDIQMPGMNGLEVASALNRLPRPPAIIFCTAHDEFALPAFAVSAAGYLVKPVQLEALQHALQRASRISPLQQAALQQDSTTTPVRSHISARTHKGLECIALTDILFFQAEHKYVTVRHLHGETLIDESLKSLEQEFGEQLIRIHRSLLVNRDAIERLERNDNGLYQLILKGCDQALPVSRRHASQVRSLMHRL